MRVVRQRMGVQKGTTIPARKIRIMRLRVMGNKEKTKYPRGTAEELAARLVAELTKTNKLLTKHGAANHELRPVPTIKYILELAAHEALINSAGRKKPLSALDILRLEWSVRGGIKNLRKQREELRFAPRVH